MYLYFPVAFVDNLFFKQVLADQLAQQIAQTKSNFCMQTYNIVVSHLKKDANFSTNNFLVHL